MIHYPTPNVGPFVELITLAGSKLDEGDKHENKRPMRKISPKRVNQPF